MIGRIFIQSYEKKPLQYAPINKENKIKNIKNMNKKSFFGFIKNLYNGRINRKNYFLGILFAGLTFLLSVMVIYALFSDSYSGELALLGGIILVLVYIAYLTFLLSLHVRRFHDKGESGWRVFLFLVPLLNLIILLTLFFEKGQEENNKYGEDPLKLKIGFWNSIFNKAFVSTQAMINDDSPETNDFRYCHKCGSRLEINSKFCTKCGTKLKD